MDKYASLTPEVIGILKDKDTEYPGTGKYNKFVPKGTYICAGCGLALFRASSQFTSGCGWPSFDDEIEGAILRESDADGRRTEILCNRCHGHMGHVFKGEGKTAKNLRHCVNSLAVDFLDDEKVMDTEEAIFAAGCFWGVQYYLDQLNGVLKTEVGYIGGNNAKPTYEEVCRKTTGHLEAVRVVYDPSIVSYEALVKYFFEIHDPEQKDGQGPDIGSQYLSGIFYFNDTQKHIAEKVIGLLEDQGLSVATKLYPMDVFWAGEEYHQDYYEKTGKSPYCHRRTKRF